MFRVLAIYNFEARAKILQKVLGISLLFILLQKREDKNQQNNSRPQQNQQIPSRNAEPKQRNITRVTGVIQTNFNHDPSEFAKK